MRAKFQQQMRQSWKGVKTKGHINIRTPFSDLICCSLHELQVPFVSLGEKHVWPHLVFIFHPLFSAASPTRFCRNHFEFQSVGHMGITGVGDGGRNTGSGQSHCQPFTYSLTTAWYTAEIFILLRLHSIFPHFASACHFVSLIWERFQLFCSAPIKTKCFLHKSEAVYEHVNV